VSGDDVRNLVGHHRREFCLCLHYAEQTGIEIDIPAGSGEGIYLVGLDYGEVVVDIFAVTDGDDSLTDFIDVILPDDVGEDLLLLLDLLGHTLPDGDFLGSGNEHQRLLSPRPGRGAGEKQNSQ